MSGDGLISVRMSRSLLEALRNTATRNQVSISEIAGRILSRTNSLDGILTTIQDPTTEGNGQRVSLYVGCDCVDMIFQNATANSMWSSSLVRRVLHGILVAESIEFVQEAGVWKLQVISQAARNGITAGRRT
jgi:hypothetical protein